MHCIRNVGNSWRVPNPPGANPLVAERPPWRSSQSCVAGGQQPIGNPYRLLSFPCTPGNPRATPIVTRGEGSFSYQGVSTRGVRHAPEFMRVLMTFLRKPTEIHHNSGVFRLISVGFSKESRQNSQEFLKFPIQCTR